MLTIQKTFGKDFHILNLTDPQLLNEEWKGGGALNILQHTVTELVNRVHPDLITVSGDIACAGYDEAYGKFADFMDTFGIPWTVVWGNHDNQNGAEYTDNLANRYLTHPLFLYKKGNPALGNGNFIIRIEEGGKLLSALILMDSHDRAPYINENGEEKQCWAKLVPAQMDWYREQIKALTDEGCKNAAMIMHIPFYGYRDASAAAYKPGIDQNKLTPADGDGDEIWNEGYESSVGVQYEGICSYELDDGVFPIVRDAGLTKYVIAGHDHINNFIIEYQGVKLVYSLKTGCGCYWRPDLNGGTVLTVGDCGIRDVHHEFVNVSELL